MKTDPLEGDELSDVLAAWPAAAPSPRFAARTVAALDAAPRPSPRWLWAAAVGLALLAGAGSLFAHHDRPNPLVAAASNADLGEIHD